MSRHKEPLGGGLWTAADPAMLESGQLSDVRNAIYLAGSQAPHRAPGRVAFGVVSATATAVAGLRDIQFDNSDHYLIALAGDRLLSAPVGDTGTFSALTTLTTSPSQLEALQYRNRFYLLNGDAQGVDAINTNTVVYLSATATGTPASIRQHGMLPVSETPNVTTAGGGTFSQTVTGYYEYWTTEVAKLTQDGAEFVMESSFTGSPATVLISTTAVVPTIQRPAVKNAISTHWRIYRSPKKEFATDKAFPIGFMIVEAGTATAAQADSPTGANTGYVFPTKYNGVTTPTDVIYDDCGAGASALGADDGTEAVLGDGSVLPKKQGVYGFTFSLSGPVVGIQVEIQAYISTGTAPEPITVHLKAGRAASGLGQAFGTKASKSGLISSTTDGSPTTLVLGGATDRWVPLNAQPFVDTDFTTADGFMVVIEKGYTTKIFSIDYVKVNVYHGASQESVVQFPSVVYTFGDISAQVGKNGPPPSASTGDFFEDSLVTNDQSNAALIRYSYPGDPEAFPETYFIDFETRENDQVRAIRVVNDHLVVWLDSSTWRVNYLPSERDASFDRGKAIKPISGTYGCVDPMCAALFSPGGGTDLVAFVSHHGIHATDGFSFETYTEGLDWSEITGGAAGTPIALINDRERSLLLYYFRNDSDYGSETYLCLPLAYGEGHWQGRPKSCSIVHMRNHSGGNFASLESAWTVNRSNGAVSNYLGYGGASTDAGSGKVYLESGTTMPALDPRLQFTTRRMYLAEEGNEWILNELYGYAFDYGATTPQVSYTVSTTKTNDTGPATRGTKTLTLAGQVLHKVGDFRTMGEGQTIAFAVTASGYAQEYLILDGEDFGEENSGR